MRRTNKRVFLAGAATAAAFALALSGCGGNDDEGTSKASSGGGEKAPIPIGQVGAYSGPVPALSGQGQGLEAWIKTVNAKGGINGHKIELYKGDSKGDPTGEISQVTQIATKHKVVAFAGMGMTTVAGVAKFLDQKRIPTIGGNTNDIAYTTNPGFYTPGAGLMGTYLGGFFAVPKDKPRFGLVYCKESAGCTTVYNLYRRGFAQINGGKPVYAAKVALSAPSFTAQCLAAKQAGVQTLAVAMDPTNMIRLAKDCAKQGFRPTYAVGGTIASDAIAKSGVADGAVSGQNQAPWFADIPSLAEHRAAMKRYFPKVPVDSTTISGWVAGIALGKAIENAYKANPDANELTSEDIFTGLGMIKAETFGGLTPPVTFTSSGVQAQSNCAFSIRVKGDTWVQNGAEPVCPPVSAEPKIDEAVKALSAG